MLKRHLCKNLKERIIHAGGDNGAFISEKLQGALPAINLTSQSAIISAISNDISPELIYAQQVLGYGKPEDVIVGLTTSGNSQNIINAFFVAKALGLTTISITGRNGGRIKDTSDIYINVPSSITPKVQELHLPVYHALCTMIEQEFFN